MIEPGHAGVGLDAGVSFSRVSLERDPIGNPDGEGRLPEALCGRSHRLSERSADLDAVDEPGIAAEVNGWGEEKAAIADADAAEKIRCAGGCVDSDASG